ncbi:MAG: acyl-CoA reductase [Acidobacteriota bacterium]
MRNEASDDRARALTDARTLRRTMARLDAGRPALEALSARRLRAAWAGVIDELLEATPGSTAATLRRDVAKSLGLSPAGLDAGLEVMLRGVRTTGALGAFDTPRRSVAAGPALVILAATPPGLAVQTLLPALAVRRPVLFKSSSREPRLTPLLVAALARREPALAGALAAVTWPGGIDALDRAALDAAGVVIAYGSGPTLASLRRHLGPSTRTPFVAHGPRASLAVVTRDALAEALATPTVLETLADGLARDIALFDQRGCLSVQAMYVEGSEADVAGLADPLGRALEHRAERWPPGPPELATTSAVRQLRDAALMQGLTVAALPLGHGTVVVDPDPAPRPSPGLRTVRIHPLDDLDRLPEVLSPWRGRLQGLAVAGRLSPDLEASLRALGVSRIAEPGSLQAPEAHAWHNAGIDPLEALAR